MKKGIICAVLLLSFSVVYAKGGTSCGARASVSRPAVSRTVNITKTIYKSAPVSSPPVYVVHNSGGGDMLTGIVIGNMLASNRNNAQNNQQSTVAQPVKSAAPVAAAPAKIVETVKSPEKNDPFIFVYLGVLAVIACIALVCYWFYRKNRKTDGGKEND